MTFSAFYPNVYYRPRMAAKIALGMARRADWVASLTDDRTREERWRTARPMMTRILDET